MANLTLALGILFLYLAWIPPGGRWRWLCRLGIVRRKPDGSVRWPVYCSPPWIWKVVLRHAPWDREFGWFGVFRNRPGVVKWERNRLLPRRWGIRVLGFELGDRGG